MNQLITQDKILAALAAILVAALVAGIAIFFHVPSGQIEETWSQTEEHRNEAPAPPEKFREFLAGSEGEAASSYQLMLARPCCWFRWCCR